MMDDTVEKINNIRKEEYRFQRIADSAKIAQRSVETLANLVQEIIEGIRVDYPLTAQDAENCLSRIPHLRKIPIGSHADESFRYVMELPISLSPLEAMQENAELEYLRKFAESKYNYGFRLW
jgi:hypothetical protein